ncbi:hypothetical protein RB653_006580 [Dictyostelium firmibasis]|uniref:PA14 domain-containing protein n=1 Tax=Dictyostelium firmibasis TaxID=79012 RepID=A0AAN7TKG4_9MYCE
MKIIISLLLNIILINYVWGQPIDDGRLRPTQQEIVIRNFKPDRSVDFGIPLSANLVKGIMQQTLGDDKRPKYCCGENSVIDDAGILIVNNEQSFNQWFNSDDVCSSYLLNFHITLDTWNNLILSYTGLFRPAQGRGFGDPTLFPEYQSDPFNQYQCFELHLSYIPLDESTDYFHLSITGEIWIYFNNTLVIDNAGDTSGSGGSVFFFTRDVPGVVYNDENYVYPIDIYSCVRSIDSNPNGLITIQGSGNFFCSWVDDGGACNGLNFMAPCVDDDITKCVEPKEVCGNCVKDLPRVCPGSDTFCTRPVCLEGYGCLIENKTVCDDLDPCTIDSCDEILGCSHEVIPNCYCNITTCFSNDLCFPKVCSGDNCITIPIDCEIEQPDCPTSVCINGVCSTCPVESSSSEDISTTGPEVTTIGPVTTTSISTSTTGAVSTTDTSISTTGISSTTGETISTIGVSTTTGLTTTTTTTTTTGASTTFSSTTSTTTPQTTSTISTGTRPPVNHAKCEHDSCPFKYHCYQLKHAYTCISKEFNDKCEPERLVLFY